MIRTANPTLNEEVFTSVARESRTIVDRANAMTINGAFQKTAILLGILFVPAAIVWMTFFRAVANARGLVNADPYGAGMAAVIPFLITGLLGGLILCLVTCFKKEWSVFTTPLYAVCEGLFLGAVSAFAETRFHGIAIQAVGVTFSIFVVLLVLYMTRVLQATPLFMKGVIAATLGIALLYALNMALRLFLGYDAMPFIHNTGLVGIGFTAFVVVLAALNLILDFALIEWGAEQGAPKYMEWYAAFGLLVTLIWLYLEVLRLLAKMRSR